MDGAPDEARTAKPTFGAILTGLLVAALCFVAATAQGMATAPSATAGIAATAGIFVGLALMLAGIGSIWLPRLRAPARIGNYIVLGALFLAFLADKVLSLAG